MESRVRVFQRDKIPRPKSVVLPHIDFDRQQVDVEIGAGQGLHAIQYSQNHPDRLLIAIERTTNKFKQLERRSRQHSLNNLIVLHADAVSVITHLFPEASISQLFLLYPNPYPKEKQANLRWHNAPAMNELKLKLRPDGHLIMSTNLKWYAEEAATRMVELWGFHLKQRREIRAPAIGRTHFERKYLAAGQTCYELIFSLSP